MIWIIDLQSRRRTIPIRVGQPLPWWHWQSGLSGVVPAWLQIRYAQAATVAVRVSQSRPCRLQKFVRTRFLRRESRMYGILN